MGTNYYVTKDKCDCCKRYDIEAHIGKASSGWSFSFHGYRHMRLVSWAAWKEYLKDRQIHNEYGEEVPYEEFVEMVEGYKSPKANKFHHNEEGRKFNWFNPEYDWDDPEGYSFSEREFS